MDRNLLIEAGAGTGKTTRLVKAILQALFIRRIPLEEIVALTFTNKAAAELKERIVLALEDVSLAVSIENLRLKPWWPSPEPVLSLSDLKDLSEAARTVLDRANISTIHSFAFSLLKRYPLAAGIDPDAEIDEKGLRYDELFSREWPLWLTQELGEQAPREKEWLELLSKITLSQIHEAVHQLADFEAPLETLKLSEERTQAVLKELHTEARALAAAHPGGLNADRLCRACEEIIGAHSSSPAVTGGGPINTSNVDRPPTEALGGDVLEAVLLDPGKPKSWNTQDLQRLKVLQAVAKNIAAGGERVIALLSELTHPFIAHFRRTLLSEGCLTHSALLFISREILKNHPPIRAALKRNIRFILIDEFQDTDPLQAELLLYLAEKEGQEVESWEQVQLEPGKLFIVGDPKQSIYRFRGADIAAYERIGNLVVLQGGLRETLETNYRSQAQILHLVNQAFQKIIQPVPELSPPYISVAPHHPYEEEKALHDVEIWLADSEEKQSVEDAQTTEAEHIAQWIKKAVEEKSLVPRLPSQEGRRSLLYRDIALIFRTYSPMDRFIEALRRHNIPFAVESERYFFTTPEVTDFINLLRAAANPEDTLSLVGFLRGSLGGMTDQDILRLRSEDKLEQTPFLSDLHERLARQPLAEVLTHIFENSYLLEMAARSYHGDQTLANITKFKRLLEGFSTQGDLTLQGLLDKLDVFFDDDKIEGESPLADENFNAVRLLTIHKAKGLEYPVVFLPSLHSSLRPHKPEPFVYDWRARQWGLSIAGFSNLDKLLLDEQTRQRESAESNRILYVAMTRARERLILSAGINLKTASSQSYFQRLLSAWDLSPETLREGKIQMAQASLSIKRLPRLAADRQETLRDEDSLLKDIQIKSFAQTWKEREAKWKHAKDRATIVNPSHFGFRNSDIGFEKQDTNSEFRIPKSEIGTLVHRFLELWDFTCKKCDMPARLRQIASPLQASAEVIDEAQKLLAGFIGSESYNEIAQSEILGREIPFFYGGGGGGGSQGSSFKENTSTTSTSTSEVLTRGAIDILYKTPNGQLVIGDYKTGRIQDEAVYEPQKKAYTEAVQKATGQPATFKTIYLRLNLPGKNAN